MNRKLMLLFTSVLANLLHDRQALACSVCFGSKDSSAVQSVSWGILVLLAVVSVLLLLVGIFIVIFAKRARLVS